MSSDDEISSNQESFDEEESSVPAESFDEGDDEFGSEMEGDGIESEEELPMQRKGSKGASKPQKGSAKKLCEISRVNFLLRSCPLLVPLLFTPGFIQFS